MDELLLQLVESLKKSMQLSAAEVWTGTTGRSIGPSRCRTEAGAPGCPRGRGARGVATRAHVQGNAWLRSGCRRCSRAGTTQVRAAPVAHLGELLGPDRGRAPADGPFTDEEDRVLGELARQVGLALHNVRLDSPCRPVLEELQVRNQELQASRARIVAAADESPPPDRAQPPRRGPAAPRRPRREGRPGQAADRRRPGDRRRDARRAPRRRPGTSTSSGSWPTASTRRCSGPGPGRGPAGRGQPRRAADRRGGRGRQRYPAETEAAVYFCCLEAMQNAGKREGGRGGVWGEEFVGVRGHTRAGLSGKRRGGHGFVNMRDRLGAFGG